MGIKDIKIIKEEFVTNSIPNFDYFPILYIKLFYSKNEKRERGSNLSKDDFKCRDRSKLPENKTQKIFFHDQISIMVD